MPAALAGKVALITGSSRGIGQAIAKRLAAEGAAIALHATKDVSATRQALETAGGRCSEHLADLRDLKAADILVSGVIARYGRLDILVNNAGTTHDALLLRMSDANWHDVMATNLNSAFACTRAALKSMLRNHWGRIISMGSVVGLKGNAGQANYTTTKAGLVGFTRSVALEVASRGITANVVAPGFIETALTAKLNAAQQEQIRAQVPLKRFGTPAEVAEVVAFLAGEDAGYITGQIFLVDGGLALA